MKQVVLIISVLFVFLAQKQYCQEETLSWSFDRPVSKKDTMALLRNKVRSINIKQGVYPKDTASKLKLIEMSWDVERVSDSTIKIINKNGESLAKIKTTNASKDKSKQVQYQTWTITAANNRQARITFKLIHFFDSAGITERSERWIIKTPNSKTPRLFYKMKYVYKDGLPDKIFIDDYDKEFERKFLIEYEYKAQ